MNKVLRIVLLIVGIILAAIGCLFLDAGKSYLTDPIGIFVLFITGVLPLALGIFLIWKSLKFSAKKTAATPQPPAPVVDNIPSTVPDLPDDSLPEDPPKAAPAPEVTSNPENTKPAEKPKYKRYSFKVAGISRRQKDITDNLLSESYDYESTKKELIELGMIDERIYKYTPDVLDAEIVPEPNNPHDPNAIKVLVDGIHIGYVPADKTDRVKKLLETKQLHDITCEFYGGPYKIITGDYDLEKDKEVYTVKKESPYIGAEITIEYE